MPIDFNAEKWMDRESYKWSLPERTCEILCMNNQRQEQAHWYIYQNALTINRSRLDKITSITERFGEWDNDNVIMVSAGPSLKKCLPEIESKQKDGFKVICVDRALRTLKWYGLQPDITISIDPQVTVAKFFECVDSNDILALNILTHPAIYDMAWDKDAKIYGYLPIIPFSNFYQNLFNSVDLKKYFCLRAHMIVSFSAIDLALLMGKNGEKRKIHAYANELSWKKLSDIKEEYTNRYNVLKVQMTDDRIFYSIPPFLETAVVMKSFPIEFPDTEFVDFSGGIIQGWKQPEMAEV